MISKLSHIRYSGSQTVAVLGTTYGVPNTTLLFRNATSCSGITVTDIANTNAVDKASRQSLIIGGNEKAVIRLLGVRTYHMCPGVLANDSGRCILRMTEPYKLIHWLSFAPYF